MGSALVVDLQHGSLSSVLLNDSVFYAQHLTPSRLSDLEIAMFQLTSLHSLSGDQRAEAVPSVFFSC